MTAAGSQGGRRDRIDREGASDGLSDLRSKVSLDGWSACDAINRTSSVLPEEALA